MEITEHNISNKYSRIIHSNFLGFLKNYIHTSKLRGSQDAAIVKVSTPLLRSYLMRYFPFKDMLVALSGLSSLSYLKNSKKNSDFRRILIDVLSLTYQAQWHQPQSLFMVMPRAVCLIPPADSRTGWLNDGELRSQTQSRRTTKGSSWLPTPPFSGHSHSLAWFYHNCLFSRSRTSRSSFFIRKSSFFRSPARTCF